MFRRRFCNKKKEGMYWPNSDEVEAKILEGVEVNPLLSRDN